MVSLLENNLVRKYFACEKLGGEASPHIDDWQCEFKFSHRVLEAMCAEVKEGELYLAISAYGVPTGPFTFTSSDVWKFHCQWLRLPNQFQPIRGKSDCVICPHCGKAFTANGEKPDPVELKIGKLAEQFRTHSALNEVPTWFRDELHELVDLARGHE